MTPIIDFHVHAGLYHELHPWVTEWVQAEIKDMEDPEAFLNSILTPEGIAGYLRANGVDYGVALAELSPITTGMMTNEGVIELCREVDFLIPFCNYGLYIFRGFFLCLLRSHGRLIRGPWPFTLVNRTLPSGKLTQSGKFFL